MSEYSPGNSDFEEQLMLMNEEDVREAQQEGENLRRRLISRAHSVVRLLLERDLDEIDAIQSADGAGSGNKNIHYYVLNDMLAAPTTSGEFRSALSVLLVPNGDLIRQGKLAERNSDRLRLFIPVASDFNPQFNDVPAPEEIYIEKTYQKTGDVERYVITERGIYGYRPQAASGAGEAFDDSLEVISHRAIMNRVDAGLSLLGMLRENVTNMSAIPQKTIPVPIIDPR